MVTASEPEIPLHPIEVDVCDLCLTGVGGECHVPGCALWLDDAPVGDALRVLSQLTAHTAFLHAPVTFVRGRGAPTKENRDD